MPLYDVLFAMSDAPTWNDIYLATTPAYDEDSPLDECMVIAGTDVTTITVDAVDEDAATDKALDILRDYYRQEGMDPNTIGLARYRHDKLEII